jgi:AraC-like DNA-binding protein/mannose-6-phosphate isomerase-like protein (cupin superfamily)
MERLTDHPQDAVTEVLRAVKVHSTVYCLSELGSPWGLRVDGDPSAKFHLVLEGSGWLQLNEAPPIPISSGELVVLPRGDGHTLRDEPTSPVRDLKNLLRDDPVDEDARLVHGGSGPLTRLLCGGFGLGEGLTQTVSALLPRVLHLDAQATGVAAWLEPIFGLLEQEANTSTPGAKAIFEKIADVFLNQALRSYLVGADEAGLLALEPLLDPPIARAVELIQGEPARDWTVAELARTVGMSRTLFTRRFRDVLGEPPMRYVTKARLGRAAGYLATTKSSVYEIALLVGYDSDAALAKAFKREFGLTPGQYRERASVAPVLAVRDTVQLSGG